MGRKKLSNFVKLGGSGDTIRRGGDKRGVESEYKRNIQISGKSWPIF